MWYSGTTTLIKISFKYILWTAFQDISEFWFAPPNIATMYFYEKFKNIHLSSSMAWQLWPILSSGLSMTRKINSSITIQYRGLFTYFNICTSGASSFNPTRIPHWQHLIPNNCNSSCCHQPTALTHICCLLLV